MLAYAIPDNLSLANLHFEVCVASSVCDEIQIATVTIKQRKVAFLGFSDILQRVEVDDLSF